MFFIKTNLSKKKRINIFSCYYFFFALFILLFSFFECSYASTAPSGQGLPWETPLEKLQRSLTGPVAFSISMIGIVSCGASLIWGGEISEFVRRFFYLVMVICLLLFTNNILGTMFSGAVIPDHIIQKIEEQKKLE